MSLNTLNTALRLYQDGALTFDQASAQSECSPAKLIAELQSRGIGLREEDKEAFGGRRSC
jgi:predicted HTH domain antitoxin